MQFPDSLWTNPEDREIVRRIVDLFDDSPLVLTDRLTNSVYFNAAGEALFSDRGESIVNRAAYSLLGFEAETAIPAALSRALLGEGDAWKGAVHPEGHDAKMLCEASAVRRDDRLLCGVIRFPRASERKA